MIPRLFIFAVVLLFCVSVSAQVNLPAGLYGGLPIPGAIFNANYSTYSNEPCREGESGLVSFGPKVISTISRPLTEEEIDQVSGVRIQRLPTLRAFVPNELSSFFGHSSSQGSGEVLNLNRTSFKVRFFYLVRVVNQSEQFLPASDCGNMVFVTTTYRGEQFIIEATLHSDDPTALKQAAHLLDENPPSLFELVSDLKTFPRELQEKILLTFKWRIDSSFDYSNDIFELSQVEGQKGHRSFTGCRVDQNVELCEQFLEKLKDFLIRRPDSFIDSGKTNAGKLSPLLDVGLTKFNYGPPKEITKFFNEKIFHEYLLSEFQDSLFHIYVKDKEKLIEKVKLNVSLINELAIDCFNGRIDCSEAYNRYLEEREPLEANFNREIKKGFTYYCQFALNESPERYTVNQIVSALGAKDCHEVIPLMGTVTVLDLENLGISNIGPLIGFDNLLNLNLRNNSVYEMSAVLSLRKLLMLDLSNNQVEGIYVLADDLQLRKLRLFGNRITSVTVPPVVLDRLTEFLLDDKDVCHLKNQEDFFDDLETFTYAEREGLVLWENALTNCSLVAHLILANRQF